MGLRAKEILHGRIEEEIIAVKDALKTGRPELEVLLRLLQLNRDLKIRGRRRQ